MLTVATLVGVAFACFSKTVPSCFQYGIVFADKEGAQSLLNGNSASNDPTGVRLRHADALVAPPAPSTDEVAGDKWSRALHLRAEGNIPQPFWQAPSQRDLCGLRVPARSAQLVAADVLDRHPPAVLIRFVLDASKID